MPRSSTNRAGGGGRGSRCGDDALHGQDAGVTVSFSGVKSDLTAELAKSTLATADKKVTTGLK